MLKDNRDINAKSTFVKSHYHGTSLSMVQFRDGDEVGTNFPEINFQTKIKEQFKKLLPLPVEYISVRDHPSKNFNERLLWAPLCSVNFSDRLLC